MMIVVTESKNNGFGCEEFHIKYFFLYLYLIFVAIVIIAATIIEILVAFNLELTQILAIKAMWTGAILWLMIAVFAWIEKFKETKSYSPVWCLLVLTIIAICTFAGIFIPSFVKFTLWSNVVLSILCSMAIVLALLKMRGNHLESKL